jgi:hypothetical protein
MASRFQRFRHAPGDIVMTLQPGTLEYRTPAHRGRSVA